MEVNIAKMTSRDLIALCRQHSIDYHAANGVVGLRALVAEKLPHLVQQRKVTRGHGAGAGKAKTPCPRPWLWGERGHDSRGCALRHARP